MKLTSIAISLPCLHFSALAARPTEASVDKLLGAMNADAMIDASCAQVESLMRNTAQQANGNRPLSASEQASLDTTVRRTMDLMREGMTWEKMKPAFIRTYVETFDREEVDGLTAFHGSRVGKSFISKVPVVMQKSMQFSQSLVQRLMPRMMQIIQESARK